MSHYNNSNNSKKLNTPAYKTFCKVCQDSGKTEKEYTNHNVRDIKGKTVCPTLLAQECRNCYKKGHTVKYCSLLKAAPEKKPYQAPVKVQQPKSKNVFMVFDDDSDSEKEQETKKTDTKETKETKDEPIKQDTQFPALTLTALQQAPKKPVLNYGTIIEQVNDPEYALALAQAKAKSKETPLPKLKIPFESQKGKLNWATAESDSEGDEDEEDAYVPPKKAVQKEELGAW